jgi:hypothetical protein
MNCSTSKICQLFALVSVFEIHKFRIQTPEFRFSWEENIFGLINVKFYKVRVVPTKNRIYSMVKYGTIIRGIYFPKKIIIQINNNNNNNNTVEAKHSTSDPDSNIIYGSNSRITITKSKET